MTTPSDSVQPDSQVADVGSSANTTVPGQPRMNPAIKARWVAALRSGEYEQGRGVLRSADNCFCCLGVLTDLAVKAGVGAWGQCGELYEFNGEEREGGLLAAEVSAWAGFGYPARCGGEAVIGGESDMLTGHNDCGRTFAEIADAIEAQL